MRNYIHILVLFTLYSCRVDDVSVNPRQVEVAQQQLTRNAGKFDEQFISQLFDICKVQISDVRRKLLTKDLIAVADQYFEKDQDKQSFLFLICIESKFNMSARSKVGAVGYSQIMPKYAQAFADMCEFGTLQKGDLEDPTINLHLGACLFSHLLKKFNGNVALALAGYNSGPDSDTTKRLSNLQTGHEETSGYLAKFLVVQQQIAQRDGGMR